MEIREMPLEQLHTADYNPRVALEPGDPEFERLKNSIEFLLTPLREGRRGASRMARHRTQDFYSRPCGRGDVFAAEADLLFGKISTHAPAGGATSVCAPGC